MKISYHPGQSNMSNSRIPFGSLFAFPRLCPLGRLLFKKASLSHKALSPRPIVSHYGSIASRDLTDLDAAIRKEQRTSGSHAVYLSINMSDIYSFHSTIQHTTCMSLSISSADPKRYKCTYSMASPRSSSNHSSPFRRLCQSSKAPTPFRRQLH